MTELRGEGGQWHSDFTVKVNAAGTITSGTVAVYGVDPAYPGVKLDEFSEVVNSGTITETAGVNYITANVSREFNMISGYTLTNVPMNDTSVTKTTYPNPFNPAVTISVPQMTAATTTDLNHGEYVSSRAAARLPLRSAMACRSSASRARHKQHRRQESWAGLTGRPAFPSRQSPKFRKARL